MVSLMATIGELIMKSCNHPFCRFRDTVSKIEFSHPSSPTEIFMEPLYVHVITKKVIKWVMTIGLTE